MTPAATPARGEASQAAGPRLPAGGPQPWGAQRGGPPSLCSPRAAPCGCKSSETEAGAQWVPWRGTAKGGHTPPSGRPLPVPRPRPLLHLQPCRDPLPLPGKERAQLFLPDVRPIPASPTGVPAGVQPGPHPGTPPPALGEGRKGGAAAQGLSRPLPSPGAPAVLSLWSAFLTGGRSDSGDMTLSLVPSHMLMERMWLQTRKK